MEELNRIDDYLRENYWLDDGRALMKGNEYIEE